MQPQAPPNLNLNSVLNAMIHTTSPITNMAQNMMNSSTYSLSQQQHNMPNDEQFNDENYLENWLSIPTKRNIKKHGWKKLYVVLKKSKLLFYNSLRDKDSQEPYMVIDLEFVCLVIFTWLVFGSIREICFHQKESLSCKSSDTDRCGASGHTWCCENISAVVWRRGGERIRQCAKSEHINCTEQQRHTYQTQSVSKR